ncbi:TraR/DksA family transcriptional regulator [Azohydromonas caseinilytica]|uniref:Molecular chaperone DnaK n=1 Tax=Azohydromonas caseinilytica TaxID=2728836 RepID=A0A848FJX6_9BURK|nr:TraR/DksA C4-type zinc finger protein [Azohydromonas caseinilytica]NML18639.1 molecular chaperone DnaK [Azohydromonas caseinilytica]
MPLTAGQRALLEALLTQRLHQLQRQLALHHGDSRVAHAQELLEARDSGREVDMALSDLELRELGDVSLALRRIHGEDYGLCADCGGSIAFDRLRAQPWVLRCVACASAGERRPGRQAHHMSL